MRQFRLTNSNFGKKSDVIKFLKKKYIITEKIIHIGDGENDLEAWKAKQVDIFVGFEVNRYSRKVEKDNEIYVKTIDEFKGEIDEIIYKI